jgi:phosphate/sulfate permease
VAVDWGWGAIIQIITGAVSAFGHAALGAGSFLWPWLSVKQSESSILVPIAAFVIPAVLAWTTARHVARQKATIDLIEKFESTDHYRELQKEFARLRQADQGLMHLVSPQSGEDRESRKKVLEFLNHYELVALGIRKKVLSASFYKRWMGGAFVRDWNAASEFIQRTRWKRPSTDKPWKYRRQSFENFEFIACKWSKKAVRLRSMRRIAPADYDIGVGDKPLPQLTDAPTLQSAQTF